MITLSKFFKLKVLHMFVKIEGVISPLFLSFFLTAFFFNTCPLEGHFLKNQFMEDHQRYTSQRYNVYSSEKHNFIWFRVFKVASFTIKGILTKNVSDLSHTRPINLSTRFKNHFKFAFVRNPWDRVVSCYFNKVLTEKAPDFKECFGKDFDFFVDFIKKLDVRRTNSHLKLQTKLIPVNQCDFIGKLDNFTDDFKYVCDVIGIKCDEIPHKHKTDHVHYSTYYTPRTRKIIAEKYKEDIEAFGFTFETE